jgi:hypothetical protein
LLLLQIRAKEAVIQAKIQEWPIDDNGVGDLALCRELFDIFLLSLLMREEGQWRRFGVQRVAAVFGGDEALNAGANAGVEESALMAEKGVV